MSSEERVTTAMSLPELRSLIMKILQNGTVPPSVDDLPDRLAAYSANGTLVTSMAPIEEEQMVQWIVDANFWIEGIFILFVAVIGLIGKSTIVKHALKSRSYWF